MVNKVFLIGNVGQDPEVRDVNGTQVADLTLATNERWKDKDGNEKSITEWHNVTMWRGLAGVVSRYVKKGDRIHVEGKITYQMWDKPDGSKGYKTVIVANEMKMLSNKSTNTEQAPSPQSGSDDIPF